MFKLRHVVTAALLALMPAGATVAAPPKASEIKDIKAYCLDFNWAATAKKRKPFAAPGSWASSDPAEHVAWYKNGFVPEQPKFKHDFLPEVVKLGHKEGMLVFGYFSVSANPKWGTRFPCAMPTPSIRSAAISTTRTPCPHHHSPRTDTEAAEITFNDDPFLPVLTTELKTASTP